jgi:hypothetical protein
MWSDPGAIFMGTTHSGSPLLHAMIEDSTEEFYTASSEDGSSILPVSQRHGTGGSPCSCRNHTMAKGCSSRSGDDNGSTMDAHTTAGHQPPL